MADDNGASSGAAVPTTVHLAELARSGRSTCKKCKQTIDKDALRLGKAFDNNGTPMKHWFHPACWPVPKALASVSEIEGWWTLSDAHKNEIIARAPNRAPPKAAQSLPAEVDRHAPSDDDGVARSSFANFVTLTERLEAEGSSLEKASIIRQHLATLPTPEDRFLTARLLMPGKKEDQRTYQLKDKSLITILSGVLRCSESAMTEHLESSTDLGLTAEHFHAHSLQQAPLASSSSAAASASSSTTAPLTLSDVNRFLDELSQPSASSQQLFARLVLRTTPALLRVVTRIVRKDLRTNAGAAIVLKGVGGEAAYEQFKAQPDSLRLICRNAGEGGGAGTSSDFGSGGGGGEGGGGGGRRGGEARVEGSMAGLGSTSSGIRVGCAFKPQLADQCKSFELPVRKYPSGFLVEVKYDGERVQVHMLKSGEVRFFTRAGKAVPEHKTSGVADALRRAFPGRDREIILDSEVVMRARDGTVLAFGAQGIHEQKKHDGATCCLLVFDLLMLDGKSLAHLSQRKRRAALEGAMTTIERHVELSACKFMRTAAELRAAFKEAAELRLEGLMVKDVRASYSVNDRKWWLKLKRDCARIIAPTPLNGPDPPSPTAASSPNCCLPDSIAPSLSTRSRPCQARSPDPPSPCVRICRSNLPRSRRGRLLRVRAGRG